VDQVVFKEQKVWGLPGNESFFIGHRSQVDHLYRSEKFFLPDLVAQSKDFLDIGCACGDFSRIVRQYNPAITYTGVDIIDRFVTIARERYPQDTFIQSDGIHSGLADKSFDLVHSSGILHLNSRYMDIVREMYRVSSRHVLCDFRLTLGPQVVGEMDVNLSGQGVETQTLPYYVLNLEAHLSALKALNPAPERIVVKGYAHPPTKAARIDIDAIIMAFFWISKGTVATGSTVVEIDLNA
jgi:SAM-dependent methyltransferase